VALIKYQKVTFYGKIEGDFLIFCRQNQRTIMNIWIWEFWAIAAIAMVIVEIFTVGFFAASIAVGCGLAAIGASVDASPEWQLFLFSIGTTAAYVFLRPLYLKYLERTGGDVKTNADALVGKVGKVTQDINNNLEQGRVAIDGDDWRAVSASNEIIPSGTRVEIVKIDSIILTVKPI
jgi:membrane protein implicated in regulation of membrane protease activity